MTQNLRIISKTLTPDDSDINDIFTISDHNSSRDWNSFDKNVAYNSGDTINGTYYSWYTATAGSGLKDNASVDAEYSICPKGWSLPSYPEWFKMLYQYVGTSQSLGSPNPDGYLVVISEPINLVLSGSFSYATEQNVGIGANAAWFTRTPRSSSDVRRVYLNNSSGGYINSYGSVDKRNGTSVRCVAR